MRIHIAVPRLRVKLSAGGLLRRALLATVLSVIVLSVIGMHQLSLGNDFATPAAGAHQHSDGQLSAAEGHELPSYAENMGQDATGMQDHDLDGSPSDSCPGCGGHSMALGGCLLALTLLVLSWWLAPPRVRHLPPRMLWRPATVAILLGGWVPALSLAELSVFRT